MSKFKKVMCLIFTVVSIVFVLFAAIMFVGSMINGKEFSSLPDFMAIISGYTLIATINRMYMTKLLNECKNKIDCVESKENNTHNEEVTAETNSAE